MAAVVDWKCFKWADCSCSKSGACGCGESCGCGTVTIEAVTKAMEEECPKSGCTCGTTCACKKGECTSLGSADKTPAEWVEFVKAKQASSV